MLYKQFRKGVVALALAGFASMALAAVTFDPEYGTGFVGKGDVQTVYSWNNATLQANADSLKFQANSTVITEVSWICTNENNQNEQIRARTTTSTVQGVVDYVSRTHNQVDGFNLTGYFGDPITSSSTEGPAVNSCPSGPWSLTTPAGDPETISSTTTLEVSKDNGATWQTLYTVPQP